MADTITVKEQLHDLRSQLDALIDEECQWLEDIKLYSASIMRDAKKMAEADSVNYVVDLADAIRVSNSAIKQADKDRKKVSRQITKVEKEIAKLEKLDVDFETDVVDEFLADWRNKVENFIREGLTGYPKELAKLKASDKFNEASGSEARDMLDFLDSQYGSLFFMVYQTGEHKMAEILDQEVKAKKANLLGRITEYTGKVKDANLYIGDDGNINGFVEGEKNKVTVQTIIAGGYNIQVAHYRLLVNVVK